MNICILALIANSISVNDDNKTAGNSDIFFFVIAFIYFDIQSDESKY